MKSVPQELHDSEINGSISWFFDSCWVAKLGDDLNGFKAEAHCESFDEAVQWLHEEAMHRFPNSGYAFEHTEQGTKP